MTFGKIKTAIAAFAIATVIAVGITAPVSATVSDEDMAQIIVNQITLDVKSEVAVLQQYSPVWDTPYTAIAEFDRVLEDATTKVGLMVVPTCLRLWLDTVSLSLRLLSMSVQAVGHAAGVADDIDRAAFDASAQPGYTMLIETAPNLLEVAACEPEPLPSNAA